LGGGRLFAWQQGTTAPQEIAVVPSAETLRGLVVDPVRGHLIIGLANERRLVRVSPNGWIIREEARDLDARAFAFDSEGRLYISDETRDVVWTFMPPSRCGRWPLYW
jgi:hypothetical protein